METGPLIRQQLSGKEDTTEIDVKYARAVLDDKRLYSDNYLYRVVLRLPEMDLNRFNVKSYYTK